MAILTFEACCRVFGRIIMAQDIKAFKISLLVFSQLFTLSNSEFIKFSKLVIIFCIYADAGVIRKQTRISEDAKL